MMRDARVEADGRDGDVRIVSGEHALEHREALARREAAGERRRRGARFSPAGARAQIGGDGHRHAGFAPRVPAD